MKHKHMAQQGGVVVRTIASEQEGWGFKSLCLCGLQLKMVYGFGSWYALPLSQSQLG